VVSPIFCLNDFGVRGDESIEAYLTKPQQLSPGSYVVNPQHIK